MSNYKTKEAITNKTNVYLHYKGGYYRLLQDNVTHTETNERGVLYEHLWPHEHAFYFRPYDLFFGKTEEGLTRFTKLS